MRLTSLHNEHVYPKNQVSLDRQIVIKDSNFGFSRVPTNYLYEQSNTAGVEHMLYWKFGLPYGHPRRLLFSELKKVYFLLLEYCLAQNALTKCKEWIIQWPQSSPTYHIYETFGAWKTGWHVLKMNPRRRYRRVPCIVW